MPRIGITGHVLLADGTAELVYARLAEELQPYAGPGLHGITCLADGADQLFARAVLALDGTYEVVIPAVDYRERAVNQDNLAAFDELLDRATVVSVMPFPRSNRQAYLAASMELLNRCERLIAVGRHPVGGHRGHRGRGTCRPRAQDSGHRAVAGRRAARRAQPAPRVSRHTRRPPRTGRYAAGVGGEAGDPVGVGPTLSRGCRARRSPCRRWGGRSGRHP